VEAVPVQRDSPAGTEADTVHSWSTRQLNTTVRSCSVPSICSWESRAVPAPPQPSATPHCGSPQGAGCSGTCRARYGSDFGVYCLPGGDHHGPGASSPSPATRSATGFLQIGLD
jgi:hypothetical protein